MIFTQPYAFLVLLVLQNQVESCVRLLQEDPFFSREGLFICHSGGSQLSVNIKPFPNSPTAHSRLLCLPLHCTALHFVAQYCTVVHYIAAYYFTLQCTTKHCTTLHFVAQNCTVVHYIAEYYFTLHYIALKNNALLYM